MEEKKMFRRIWKNEDGQAMVEYGLIIALIAIIVIGAVALIGENLDTVFGNIATELGGAG
jgi:pilus assembly protein Flp/PilA